MFDHIKHIREIKDLDYYNKLSEDDVKTFNKYIILMGLGMDENVINNISFISKYSEILPNASFYKVCIDIVPKSTRFCKWIKASNKSFNKTLIELVAKYFNISKHEAYTYCITFFKNEENLLQLTDILSKMGIEDKQIEMLLTNEK